MSGKPPELRPAFVLLCRDAESAADARQELLSAHLDFVAANIERYLVAGPLRAAEDPSGDAPIIGSLFVVHAEDEADLHAFMSGDPYYASGIYAQTKVFAFNAAAGSAVGGITWSRATTNP